LATPRYRAGGEAILKSLASTEDPLGGALNDAARRIRCRGVGLSRLFEALSSADGGFRVVGDADGHDDAAFWAGLRDLMGEILQGSGAQPTAKDEVGDASQTRSAAVAADLARDVLVLDLGRIIEDHQDGWEGLVKAIREERMDSEDHLLDSDQHLELYSKLVTTLPAELRPEFRRLTMSRTIADIIERQAAFELGRQVERQRIKR